MMTISNLSFSKENFGTNQLLDNSMSLSPLIPIDYKWFARQHCSHPPSKFPLTSMQSRLGHYLSGTSIKSMALSLQEGLYCWKILKSLSLSKFI